MPTMDQEGQLAPTDRGFVIGRVVSQIFHPTLNAFASYLLVGAAAPGMSSLPYGLGWAAICILTMIIPPAIYFYIRFFRGAYSDEDVSRRSERTGLYIVSLLTTGIGSALLYVFGVPEIFLRLNVTAVGVMLVCMLINLRWKISVHSASIATLSTLAMIFFQSLGIVLWFCALLVGWARVRTGNHTPLQVLGGWIIAVLGVVLAFSLRF